LTVELHGAFVWDCDDCGAENFERAIEGNVDEAAMEAAENQVVGELIAPEATERSDGLMESEVLVQQILIAPRMVTCRQCRAIHATEVATTEDDTDDTD
jgi:Zn-finger protein